MYSCILFIPVFDISNVYIDHSLKGIIYILVLVNIDSSKESLLSLVYMDYLPNWFPIYCC